MAVEHPERLVNHISDLLQRNIPEVNWDLLTEKIKNFNSDKSKVSFYTIFTTIPLLAGKTALQFSEKEQEQLSNICPGFSLFGYTTDRLARVWLLLQWPSTDKLEYVKTITGLFKGAAVNELVALYGAMPLLNYPEEWIKQCTEGIRSNIGPVQEAIMLDNPYPALYLDEAAWNQMVLKAFFTDKAINRIKSLHKRANQTLAYTLADYAQERFAAGRTIDPELWQLVSNFIDEQIFVRIKKIYDAADTGNRKAIALACVKSNFALAQELARGTQQL